MNKRTQTALLESIEKWRLVERGEMPDVGPDNCSLCMEFLIDGCRGCPVMEKTGSSCCMDTPHERWCAAQPNDRTWWEGELVADTPELVRLARAEHRFLESLLPRT